MTHPLTPREKVARLIWERFAPSCDMDEANAMRGEYSEVADAILTALASGSGDHAELIEDAMDALQIIDAFPSNQGEVEGRITEKGDRMLSSCTRDVRRALEALLAENAALRADGEVYQNQADHEFLLRKEAERKLAEAAATLELAAIRFDEIYEAAEVDDVAYRNEATIHGINGLADVAQAEIRAFLSKEAERG